MNLAELLQKLSYGPLSDLAIGGKGSGTIPPADVPKVILRIGNALSALYTRLPLQKKTLILELVAGQYVYPLRKEYAQTSGSTEPVKFIQDTVAAPFLGDVLMVTDVFNSDHLVLPLNDRRDETSWFTQSFDALSMDYPEAGARYYVNFRAAHAALPLNPAEPSTVEIALPAGLESALLNHVGGNIYAGMNSAPTFSKAQALLTQYENEVALAESMNLYHGSEAETSIKPLLGGWVRNELTLAEWPE